MPVNVRGMELKDLKIMRGPNYWSPECNKTIVLKLEAERSPESIQVSQVIDNLSAELGSEMSTHTDLASVIAELAILLQQLADIQVDYRTSRDLKPQRWAAIFEYSTEESGELAGELAVEYVQAILNNEHFDLQKAIDNIRKSFLQTSPDPGTKAIIREARKRNIPYQLSDDQLLRLGYGIRQKTFQSSVASTTSESGIQLASDKNKTKEILSENGYPVPKGFQVTTLADLRNRASALGFPLVVKPLNGNQGRGITVVHQESQLEAGFKLASKISEQVIIEKFVSGNDYRLLVIDNKLVAASLRTPPSITGNGASTVEELIAQLNSSKDRGEDHTNILSKVEIDEHTVSLLGQSGYTLTSIIPAGEKISLKSTANLSSGATAEDVTEQVHVSIREAAENIARLVNLDICGIDLVAADISQDISTQECAFVEVNAGPGFRMHLHPSEGEARDIAAPVVDMLFPNDDAGRIPIVAVTGTNGKTTVVRLMAHIAGHNSKLTGFTTTEGIYIDNEIIVEGDCSGPRSAATVLNHPQVEFAVLECARGGMLRSGLAFDACDVSVLTNVTEDHLGLDDVYSLEEYARVKEVVPQSTRESGTSVLNADDDLVFRLKDKLRCAVTLFSMNPQSERIREHCRNGGKALIVREDAFVFLSGNEETRVVAVADIPITENGTATYMVKNVMAAIAAAEASGFELENIATALTKFYASPETTPGRMNLFGIGHTRVMLDYAHNAGGYGEIEAYMQAVPASRKVGIIAATGDRKHEDIIRLGQYAGRIFTHVIIRHDADSRGSDNSELTALLKQGIHSEKPDVPVEVISQEEAAIRHAIETADDDTFIFAAADKVFGSIAILKKLQQEYGQEATADKQGIIN